MRKVFSFLSRWYSFYLLSYFLEEKKKHTSEMAKWVTGKMGTTGSVDCQYKCGDVLLCILYCTACWIASLPKPTFRMNARCNTRGWRTAGIRWTRRGTAEDAAASAHITRMLVHFENNNAMYTKPRGCGARIVRKWDRTRDLETGSRGRKTHITHSHVHVHT